MVRVKLYAKFYEMTEDSFLCPLNMPSEAEKELDSLRFKLQDRVYYITRHMEAYGEFPDIDLENPRPLFIRPRHQQSKPY